MPQIGPAEILVILLVGMLVFGPKRLPEIGRQIGRGLHEVKKFQTTITNEIESAIHAPEAQAAPKAEVATPAPVRPAAPSARPPSRFRAPDPVSSTRA